MFSWLFGNRDVRQTAAIVHQMCHMGRQANFTFGTIGAQGVFKRHPFLTTHVEPNRNGEPHQFRFRDELEPFEFLVYENKDVIQLLGYGDYSGLTVTTTERSGYIVFVTQPLSRAVGSKAKAFATELVRSYGAVDTSEYSSRGVK
jgi:hypothetical protein